MDTGAVGTLEVGAVCVGNATVCTVDGGTATGMGGGVLSLLVMTSELCCRTMLLFVAKTKRLCHDVGDEWRTGATMAKGQLEHDVLVEPNQPSS